MSVVPKTESRKYSQEYLNFGFTTTEIRVTKKSPGVLFAEANMKPDKLRRHLKRRFMKTEKQQVEAVFGTIESHSTMMAKNFKKYFLADDNLIANYEWIRDPFQNTTEGLLTSEEIFMDFTSNGEIKRQFSNKSLFEI
ncbi:zinc finger BED domain-containing protein 5 [Trichonephila clavipes]|nr:zinc finger BED domain-containing protein 5 [Trichonephila clavipes]